MKSQAQAGQQGSGWARAEHGLDPGLGRLISCSLDVRDLHPVERHYGHAQADVVPEQLVRDHVLRRNPTHPAEVAQCLEDVPQEEVPREQAPEHVQEDSRTTCTRAYHGSQSPSAAASAAC